ncbi:MULTISPECIES: glycoside hydrolase family 18 protein [unclassified Saccharicrinis]|uniref:glycoside hydrolase family 18 protein n=1 Tax=unclassified Saccharicrinis TaxID=2646859 RepID=UPI003D32B801
MGNLTKICKLYLTKLLVAMLLFVALFFQNEMFAQTTNTAIAQHDTAVTIKPSTIHIDRYQDTSSTKGLKKILQPLKFKENREKKLNKEFHEYVKSLIDNKKLKINPKTVEQITEQLAIIESFTNSNHIQLDSAIKSNDSTSQSLKKTIEDAYLKMDTNKVAYTSAIDSLNILMSAILQENANINNMEGQAISAKIDTTMKEIQKVKYSKASNLAKVESAKINDTLRYFKRSLIPKMKIIGWHSTSSQQEDEFKFRNYYKYNYLSAINLFGYELTETGKNSKPNDIDEFKKENGVIKYAHNNGCNVVLTVYDKSVADINAFLKSADAQETFFNEVSQIIRDNDLNGINIYFTQISDSQLFVQFIGNLYKKLKSINPKIQLGISVPAWKDQDSLNQIRKYDLAKLDSMVDYYMILTDDLIPSNATIAQPSSPLFKDKEPGFPSIKRTMDFYLAQGIASSKLIMTVSYSGTLWRVKNFSGSLVNKAKYRTLSYSDILNVYLYSNNSSIIQGFDPIQVGSYLNIIGKNIKTNNQLWYDDFRSLYLKYNWASGQELGGVAISDLSHDDNCIYPELWNALAASLIKIDTTYVKNPNEPSIKGLKKLITIIKNTSSGFHFTTLSKDARWARESYLRYKSGDSTCVFKYESVKDSLSNDSIDKILKIINTEIKDTIRDYMITDSSIWNDTTIFKEDSATLYLGLLEHKSNCYSLYARWKIYALFLKYFAIIFAILTIGIFFLSNNSDRYKLGSIKTRKIIRNLPSVLTIFTIIFLALWLYFDPFLTGYGAGSAKDSDTLLMLYTLFIGIATGVFITYRYFKHKKS